ncbi:hypothetical protein WR25_07128 [Diploscapter pachys]|uniref:Spondin-like TSP1 domain-containing protein n=1 Tax=Diploscapter pachys TaxID=2018661 RepID=A0A2A2JF05_9BILA|nr:hypothetical protein WR25_07128 [Diploscapter pachys]
MSTCSATCGQGERSRTRFCHQGTNRCDGKDFEAERCDAGPCPEWSTCSATCGQGIATRSRSCLGGAEHLCPGRSTEQKTCEDRPCSQWAPWQEWGLCSASCGNGMKRRQRICQYGTDCPGPNEESLFCYGPPCAQWTEWCEWTSCSSKCGPGQRTRTRSCQTSDGRDSNDCQGQSVENLPCEGTSCCSLEPWCSWSKCDAECGVGRSIRTRICTNRGSPDPACHCDGSDREERQCNAQACAPRCDWTQWCEWSTCSSTQECVVGVHSRSRQCVGEAGCNCIGMADESQQCRGTQPCKQEPPC